MRFDYLWDIYDVFMEWLKGLFRTKQQPDTQSGLVGHEVIRDTTGVLGSGPGNTNGLVGKGPGNNTGFA